MLVRLEAAGGEWCVSCVCNVVSVVLVILNRGEGKRLLGVSACYYLIVVEVLLAFWVV